MRRSLLGVALVGAALWAGSAVQIGPVAPSPASKNPTCSDNSVQEPDNSGWRELFRWTGNPLSTMVNGQVKVLSAANPRITITRRNASAFDWTSDVPVVAVIVKASNTANIYYYVPPATSGDYLLSVDYGTKAISHIAWCVGGVTGPTTTTRPPTTTSSTTRPPTTTTSTTRPPTTTTSTTRPPSTTTSTRATVPPE